jgi:hypothetical protein
MKNLPRGSRIELYQLLVSIPGCLVAILGLTIFAMPRVQTMWASDSNPTQSSRATNPIAANSNSSGTRVRTLSSIDELEHPLEALKEKQPPTVSSTNELLRQLREVKEKQTGTVASIDARQKLRRLQEMTGNN